MSMGGNKPKPAFFVAIGAVVLGLLAFSYWRCSAKKEEKKTADITLPPAEDPTGKAKTTFEEYTFDPSTVLTPFEAASDYTSIGKGKDRVVRFAINIWAGWAPIIYANNGLAPGKIWKDAKGEDFKVELVLIDNPSQMGDTFASGKIQIGWATVDMMPLIVQRLNRDPRTMPRIYQQIDWSNGGDGIVVHDAIKSVADLRGKTVVLAQNSPSHYFLLNALLNGGVQPSEVHMDFTTEAFGAAAAFNKDPKYAGVVTWAPDIYTLTEVKGNKMLITTADAKKLIADVWFARADFARDNPEVIEGLVKGILEATDALQTDKTKEAEAANLLDKAYALKAGDGLGMIHDAHWTNYAENREFFLNQNNPTNFERTYNTAFLLYKAIGALDINKRVPFDQIMDFSVIKKLGDESACPQGDKAKLEACQASAKAFAASKDTYTTEFTPVTSNEINVEDAVITKTVTIAFCPNQAGPYCAWWQIGDQPYFDCPGKPTPPAKGELCDANAENTVSSIGQLAGQYGAARIQIEGHTDATRKGSASEDQVRELSLKRANAVKDALIQMYPSLPPNQFVVAGFGWDKPFDPSADQSLPENQAKNRRVEVRVIPSESQ